MKNLRLSIIVLLVSFMTVLLLPVVTIAAPYDGSANIDRAERIQMRLNLLDRYLQVVESMHSIADDPEKAVLFQLQQLEDLYKKQRDPKKIISLYQDVLKNTANATVRNAASMKLAQLLKRAGRESEAEELTRNSLNENLSRLK
ncbi:hypothetical protein [Kaarinaea lacus]